MIKEIIELRKMEEDILNLLVIDLYKSTGH